MIQIKILMDKNEINEISIIEYDIKENNIVQNRLSMIKYIFTNFLILFNKKDIKDITVGFKKEKKICID